MVTREGQDARLWRASGWELPQSHRSNDAGKTDTCAGGNHVVFSAEFLDHAGNRIRDGLHGHTAKYCHHPGQHVRETSSWVPRAGGPVQGRRRFSLPAATPIIWSDIN